MDRNSNVRCTQGRCVFFDIAHFIRKHHIKPGQALSLHCQAAVCIRKGKVGKENEFGRVFQLGRIGGNFMVPFTCTDPQMNDKSCFIPALEEHAKIFGQDSLISIATDRGYYAHKNVNYCKQHRITTCAPGRTAEVALHFDQSRGVYGAHILGVCGPVAFAR